LLQLYKQAYAKKLKESFFQTAKSAFIYCISSSRNDSYSCCYFSA